MPRKKKATKKVTKKAKRAKGKKKRTSKAELEKITPDILAMFAEGATQASVAKRFGLAVPTVARIAKNAGLKAGRSKKTAKRVVKKTVRGKKAVGKANVGGAGIYLVMADSSILHVANSEESARAFAFGYRQGNPNVERLSLKKVSKVKEIGL